MKCLKPFLLRSRALQKMRRLKMNKVVQKERILKQMMTKKMMMMH